ncbi:DUF6783 domain-containing protein [Ruminococcus sp. RTP21484sp1_RTP31003st1_F6_RTP31003_210430]
MHAPLCGIFFLNSVAVAHSKYYIYIKYM